MAGAAGNQNPPRTPSASGADPSAPGDASARRDAVGEEPAERRILLFVDGHVWRGPTRHLPDRSPAGRGWELGDGRSRRTVDATEIASARLEREVLQDLATLSRGLAPEDDVRRLALCAWMRDQGLLPECLRELDRVAAVRPDDPRVRALVADRTFAGLMPPADADPARELARTLREGAAASPAWRELWTARLAAHPDREAVLKALASELEQGVAVRREFAVRALRRVQPGAALPALERLAIDDRSRGVTKEARRALRDAADPVVVAHLAPLVESRSARERIGAIDALGEAGYEAALAPLVSHLAALMEPSSAAGSGAAGNQRRHLSVRNQVGYVRDYDLEIAQGSSIADPIVGFAEDGTTLDVAVVTWQLPVEVRYEGALTSRALARIVRDGVQRSPADWQRWWREREAQRKSAEKTRAGSSGQTPSSGTQRD